MAGKKIFLTALIAAFLTITLGGVFLSLMLQQRGLREEVEVLRKELRDEANSRTAILKKMDLNQQLLFRNLNESREVLKLPGTKAISVYPEPEKAPEASGGGRYGNELREEQFFRGVRHFSEYYRNRRLGYRMDNFLKSREMREILKGDDLSLLKSEELVYLLKRIGDLGTVFFVIRGQYDDGVPVLWVTSMLKQEARFSLEGSPEGSPEGSIEPILEKVEHFLDEQIGDIVKKREIFRTRVSRCRELEDISEIAELLAQKGLELRFPEKAEGYATFNAEVLLSPGDSPEDGRGKHDRGLLNYGVRYPSILFFIEQNTYNGVEDFRAAFIERVNELDTRSSEDRRVEDALERLKKLARDPAFRAYLEGESLRMKTEPREDGDYYYFDLMDGDGQLYGSFAVLKKYGEVYLSDREDVVISSLKALDSASRLGLKSTGHFFQQEENTGFDDAKDLPDAAEISMAGQSDETILLLCGTHEKNADTIMIARLAGGRLVRLLSVPRDIYYKNRKLSTHYLNHGMKGLKDIIGELTDLRFDGYISVDMYAFIDIINLLNGIDVRLDEPLIDPTYRVRENGEWSTLYYPAGTHHLSGIEALRVVRSRHTSDDFDRSLRQQLVLKSLLDRLNQVHAGKLKEIYDLFQILYRYVDTDLGAYELVQFYLRYHDAEVHARKSISTDNILYTTYSNFYFSGLTEEDVDDDFYKGAWILLPKENDWDLLNRFVYTELYGE